MLLNLEQTYLQLAPDGTATPLPGGEAFWSLPEAEIDRHHLGWLVSEFVFSADWPNWEMHPEGDELVYLLSGAATLLLALPDGVQAVALAGRGAVLVPHPARHTADVTVPSRVMHVTRGTGTQHRPRYGAGLPPLGGAGQQSSGQTS